MFTCGNVLCAAMSALPCISAASSRSLFVIVPFFWSADTSAALISGGNGALHSAWIGEELLFVMNVQQPPIPFDASVVPTTWGGCGTTVWMGTACWAAVLARITQSFMAFVNGVSWIRLDAASVRVNCKVENKFLAPYKEGAELHRVPSSFRNVRFDTCLRNRMCCSCSLMVFKWCSGRVMVMAVLLMSQPSMHLQVKKEASPFAVFYMDTTGHLMVIWGFMRTESMECRRWFMAGMWAGAWAMTMKSSMYISMCESFGCSAVIEVVVLARSVITSV